MKMRHLNIYNLADDDEDNVNDEDNLFALTYDGKSIIKDDYEVLNRILKYKR